MGVGEMAALWRGEMKAVRSTVGLIAAGIALASALGAGLPGGPGSPASKPIAAGRGKVVELLKRWHAAGTAAGNAGDWYDNRDRGHSGLRMSPYPQLQKVGYTAAQLKRRFDWAGQRVILPKVVFGNSSTSASFARGGSNVRQYYSSERRLRFLHEQYTHNNLYIYPEHRDHDTGHNGAPGHGDAFPTNTPYLICSQGSSGSDQAFMRAMPQVLAAFRPAVKRRLVATGLLMPTVQMILRMTGRQLPPVPASRPAKAYRKAYLSGKAHPTVFAGGNVDALAMVRMAHGIRPENIPPMIRLVVAREDEPKRGLDYFDPARSEAHADTPCVIARIWRGRARRRTMTVSAAGSEDVNRRPLTFHWVVLRGDDQRVRIRKLNAAGSLAEITLDYHERRPIAAGSAMASNRVDVGVFVHNGAYYSAPGFVTFLSLDSEARCYDEAGRIVEIGYGAGESRLAVADWGKLAAMLKAKTASPGVKLLAGRLGARELAAIRAAGEAYAEAKAASAGVEATYTRALAARKKATDAAKDAAKALAAAKKAKAGAGEAQAEVDAAAKARTAAETAYRSAGKARSAASRKAADIFTRNVPKGLKRPAGETVLAALTALTRDPGLHADRAATIERLIKEADAKRKAPVAAARKALVTFGLLADRPGAFELRPIRPGSAPPGERLTRYESGLLQRYHAAVLCNLLFPGVVSGSVKLNYADPRLTAPKGWRDVYRYAPDGTPVGWTRYDSAGRHEFNGDGLLVSEADAAGRCVRAREVVYFWAGSGRTRAFGWRPTDELSRYTYSGPTDWAGRPAAATTRPGP